MIMKHVAVIVTIYLAFIQACNASERVSGERLVTPNGLAFRYCPAGRYNMGSDRQDEVGRGDHRTAEVAITQPFWLLESELTQSQWFDIMSTKPWMGLEYVNGDSSSVPASYVSYNDATEFCQKLTMIASVNPEGNKVEYRLPSEAEWEYACRAGNDSIYCYGADIDKLHEYAVFESAQSIPMFPSTAKSKLPNSWGFYDMHGNVGEWCLDGYQESLLGGNDPLIPPDRRVVFRGGSFESSAAYCRSSTRYYRDRKNKISTIGFRIVMRESVGMPEEAPRGVKTLHTIRETKD